MQRPYEMKGWTEWLHHRAQLPLALTSCTLLTMLSRIPMLHMLPVLGHSVILPCCSQQGPSSVAQQVGGERVKRCQALLRAHSTCLHGKDQQQQRGRMGLAWAVDGSMYCSWKHL